MGYLALSDRHAIKIDDLTAPTAAKKYKLGLELVLVDEDTGDVKKFLYVKSHAALTQYQPYQLTYLATADAEISTKGPVTLGAGSAVVVVPQVAFTSGHYGFVQTQGDARCKVPAATHAVGDFLEVLTTGTTAVVDGTSGATILTTKSFAVSKAAGSSATDISVGLNGRNVEIAAT